MEPREENERERQKVMTCVRVTTLCSKRSCIYLPSVQLAARNGHSNAIRILVERGGADVQERNATTGWVALHEAAFRGHLECVRVLLQLNAPLRPRTPEEDTPKELAVRYKQKEVVELLGMLVGR